MVHQPTNSKLVDPERENQFLRDFPDYDTCLDYLLRLRFGSSIECPKCGRTAKFHKMRQIPAYACQWCGHHLHPMAQTRLARSRTGLEIWFHAVFLYSNASNGVSARELQQRLGLGYKTAWRMRNSIIDAKFSLHRRLKAEDQVGFEDLLEALVAPHEPSQPKRSGRSEAAKPVPL